MVRIALLVLLTISLASASNFGRFRFKSTNSKPYLAVGDCPISDGQYPVYLPDDKDCSVFYECANRTPMKFHCALGDLFDSERLICVSAEDAKCYNSSSGNKLKTARPYKPEGTCPEVNGDQPTYFGDSDNCQVYYECSNGVPVQNVCAGNLQWNDQLHVCDFPNVVKCDKGQSSRNLKTFHPYKPEGTCPEVNGDQPTYFGDSDNCQIYYECSNGVPVQNVCAGDLQWNDQLHVCDFPINVKCEKGKSLRMARGYSAVGECLPDGEYSAYLPDDEDCSAFYLCANGTLIKFHCVQGDLFDSVRLLCVRAEDAQCYKASS